MPAAIKVRTHCITCKKTKAPDDFPVAKRAVAGRASQCKDCVREYQRRWRATDKGKSIISAAGVKYRTSELGRQRRRDSAEVYKKTVDPMKIRARQAVADALRRGSLGRQPCSACGAEQAECHHDDYGKPLDVVWLCRACHILHHKEGG